MISGKTTLVAHIGYPTFAFKAPFIYNPWFDAKGIDAVVMPMGVTPEEYREFFPHVFRMTNIRGALVTRSSIHGTWSVSNSMILTFGATAHRWALIIVARWL